MRARRPGVRGRRCAGRLARGPCARATASSAASIRPKSRAVQRTTSPRRAPNPTCVQPADTRSEGSVRSATVQPGGASTRWRSFSAVPSSARTSALPTNAASLKKSGPCTESSATRSPPCGRTVAPSNGSRRAPARQTADARSRSRMATYVPKTFAIRLDAKADRRRRPSGAPLSREGALPDRHKTGRL